MITEAENIALQINDLKKDKNIEYADITILVKNRTHITFRRNSNKKFYTGIN